MGTSKKITIDELKTLNFHSWKFQIENSEFGQFISYREPGSSGGSIYGDVFVNEKIDITLQYKENGELITVSISNGNTVVNMFKKSIILTDLSFIRQKNYLDKLELSEINS